MCRLSQTYLTTDHYFKERLLTNTFLELLKEVGVFLTMPLDHKDISFSEGYH